MENTKESKTKGISGQNHMYRCTYDTLCDFRTVYRHYVDRHISSVHKKISLPKKFHCPQSGCDYRSTGNWKVKQNFNNKHNESRQKPKFPCPICTKILYSKFTLQRHTSMHTREYRYYCDQCKFKTSYTAALQKHREMQHLGLNLSAERKNTKCDKCDLSFLSKAHLANHMVVHSDEMPFVCTFPGCEFRSKYRLSLKEHEGRHSSKRKFACPMCRKRFHTNYEMNRHVVRLHTAEKSVKCDLCPYLTFSRSNLMYHKARKHKTDGENINNNNSSADPEKPGASQDREDSKRNEDRQRICKGYYVCEQPGCGFRTKSKHYIDKHALRVHARQRLHSCSICFRRFFDEPSVVNHMRTHTGERPFKCPFCDYAAARDCNVLRHVKICHRDKIKIFKSLSKYTRSGNEGLTDVLLSSLVPLVLLERTICQFV